MNRLVCVKCNRSFSLEEKIWKCTCGGLLDLQFQPAFPVEKIKKRKPTLWRYREAIPISGDQNIISFGEGFTPLASRRFRRKNYMVETGSSLSHRLL